MKKKTAAAVISAALALSIPAVSNAALDAREISIVPIAAYTALGNESALKKSPYRRARQRYDRKRNQRSFGPDVCLYGVPEKPDRFGSVCQSTKREKGFWN